MQTVMKICESSFEGLKNVVLTLLWPAYVLIQPPHIVVLLELLLLESIDQHCHHNMAFRQ